MDGLNPSNPQGQPPAPQPKDKDNNPTPPAPQAGNQSSAEMDALKRQVEQLTKERDTFAKAEEDRKTAELSETEKAQKRATEAEAREKASETKYTESRKRSAVELAAAKRNCVDTDLLYKAIDPSQLELLADGTVKGVDKVLDALAESKPYLFGATESSTTTTGSGAAGAGAGGSKRKITPSELSRIPLKDFDQVERDVKSGKIRL